MELKLFEFVNSAVKVYDNRRTIFSAVEKILKETYSTLAEDAQNSIVGIHTRIKSRESVQEKLLRNKFYLNFDSGEEAIDHLHDIIGITIECRFIRNETELYQKLFRYYDITQSGYSRSHSDPNNYLILHMVQPQLQRNGFTIYRIDGYYMYEERRVNYELQIKALVHRFWSEIEHEVVYKNPDFVAYDRFMKSMLGAVRDNLDVVDRQLEIIYNEISNESRSSRIGIDDRGFKLMTASSINELVNRKMKESIGFSMDFKKASSILAQYVYITHFLNGEDNKIKMVDYLEHLNLLSQTDFDFRSELVLEKPYIGVDNFCQIVGDYCLSVINTDFEWHVFFVMLLAIQQGSLNEDFADFVEVIEKLLIQPGWYRERFKSYSIAEAAEVRDFYKRVLAEGLIREKKIDFIYEDVLLKVMNVFRTTVERAEKDYPQYANIQKRLPDLEIALLRDIHRQFQ